MTDNPASRNIVWHESETSGSDRRAVLKQKGCVLWFTGLSGSGKSTIAHALEKQLIAQGQAAYVLDGDNVRHGLNKDLGFSPEDRAENLRRIAEVAKLFSDSGVICITAFISPLRSNRDTARDIVGTEMFHEVFISTPLEECERRDTKGMYKKARDGEIPEFTGVSSPYEPPENPSISIDTTEWDLEASVTNLISWLRNENIIGFEESYSI